MLNLNFGKSLKQIGSDPWSREEMLNSLEEFLSIYPNRPVKDNQGGMLSPHCFAMWFMARKLNPDIIIESGIFKGQSTWLLEQACPDATLYCIDINLANRQYISPKATYFSSDFSKQDWANIPLTERSLGFFDDHQNAYQRVMQCAWFGLRHMIFEDNYPDSSNGDCYSLKQVFARCGSNTQQQQQNLTIPGQALSNIVMQHTRIPNIQLPDLVVQTPNETMVAPNPVDAAMLEKKLETYYEFPPVCKTDTTRFGTAWTDTVTPTQVPLFPNAEQLPEKYRVFLDEAQSYTWMAYAHLKG